MPLTDIQAKAENLFPFPEASEGGFFGGKDFFSFLSFSITSSSTSGVTKKRVLMSVATSVEYSEHTSSKDETTISFKSGSSLLHSSSSSPLLHHLYLTCTSLVPTSLCVESHTECLLRSCAMSSFSIEALALTLALSTASYIFSTLGRLCQGRQLQST